MIIKGVLFYCMYFSLGVEEDAGEGVQWAAGGHDEDPH